jgi:hypothetical protein
VAKPLNRLTCKDQPFVFNTRCKQAFKELKRRLVSALLLCHFDLALLIRLETDAFDRVVAGVLS